MKLRTQFFAILLISFGSLLVLLFIGRQRLEEAVDNTNRIVERQFNPIVLENAPQLQKTYEGLTALLETMGNAQVARMMQLRSITLNSPDELAPLIQESEDSLVRMQHTLEYAEATFPKPVLEAWSGQKTVLEQWKNEEESIIALTKDLAIDLEQRALSHKQSQNLFAPFRASIDVLGEQIDEQILAATDQENASKRGAAISLVLNADRDAYQALLSEQQILSENSANPATLETLEADHRENLDQIRDRLTHAKALVDSSLHPSFELTLRHYEKWREASETPVAITARIHDKLLQRQSHVAASRRYFQQSQEKLALVNDRLRSFAEKQLTDFQIARDNAITVNRQLQSEAQSYTRVFNILALIAFVSFILLLVFQRRLVYSILKLSKYLSKLDESNLSIPYQAPKQAFLPSLELEDLEHSLNTMRHRLVEVIQDHKSALSLLAKSEALFSSLFYNSFSPMLLVEPKSGAIVDCNDVAAKLYKTTGNDLRSSNVTSLEPQSQTSKLATALARLDKQRNDTITLVQTDREGHTFDVEIYAGLIGQEGQSHAFLIVRDISERLEVERQLLEEKERAEAANLAKDEFLSVMSHELRTPLNPIIGYAQILNQQFNEPIVQECSRVTLNAARRMLDLVESILFFTELDSDGHNIPKRSFTLTDLLEEPQNAIQLDPQNACITIINGFDKYEALSKRSVLNGPISGIRQILTSFIDNAKKYANQSKVEIRVGLYSRNSGACDTLRIEVRDQGDGVPAGYQARLFDPFTQADSSFTRAHEGLGLGLAICRKLAGIMKSKIGYTPNIPRGSIFWLDCPISLSEDLTPENASQALAPSTPNELAVVQFSALVIEDNSDNREYLRRALTDLGVSPTCVESGEKAVEFCLQNHYDLVFLDLSMPGMDGMETLARLRGIPSFAETTRCIAVSAHTAADLQKKCLELGFETYLVKPVSIDQLSDTIFLKTPEK